MPELPQREKLYDEVWSVPMIHLAKRYGLAGPDLRKICLRLGVPVPEQGHWSKIAAGHSVPKPPLPETPPRSNGVDTSAVRKPARQVTPRLSVDEKPTPRSNPPPPEPSANAAPAGQAFHPLVRLLVEIYEREAKEALQLKAKHDWEVANPGRTYRGPTPRHGAWPYLCDRGQILAPTHKKSVLRVSLQTYQRALRVLNSMAVDLEKAGYALSFTARRERLVATRDGARIEVRIAERLEAGTRFDRINSFPKEREHVKTLTPTKRLTLGVEQMGLGETVINDNATATLEDQWDKVLAAAEYRLRRSQEVQAEWNRDELERQETARRRAEEQRLREEARRSEEEEKAKREALLHEARDWRSSELLRSYVAHLDSRRGAGGVVDEDFMSWRIWALGVADALDKSAARVLMSAHCDGHAPALDKH